MPVEIFMVIGYVLMGSAVGLFITGAIAHLAQPSNTPIHHFPKFAFMVSFPLMVLGVVFTLFHLGNIGYFYGILFNPNSWLMRESWIIGFFTLATFIAFILAMRAKETPAPSSLRIVVIAGIILGALLLFAMSMSYMVVYAIPSWNNLGVLLTNLAEAAAIGTSISAAYVALRGDKENDAKLLKCLTIAMVASIAAAALTFFVYNVSLSLLPMGQVATSGTISTLVVVKYVALVAALVLAIYALFSASKVSASLGTIAAVIVIAVLASDVISRVLHFLMATHQNLIL